MAIGTPTLMLSAPVTSTTNNTTVSGTTNIAGTAGSLIVAICASRSANVETCTFSGGGLTWTTKTFSGAANGGIHIGYAQDPSGIASGTTITATLGANSSRKGLSVYKVTGLATSSVEDTGAYQGNNSSSGNATVTSSTGTAQASNIIFFAAKHNAASGTVTGTDPTGYTELDDFIAGASTFMQQYSAYRIISASETPSATTNWTDTSTNWQAEIVVFKGAGGATTYPITVTASATSTTASVTRQLGTTVTAGTVGTSASVIRRWAETITAGTVGTTASVIRKLLKPVTASTVGTTASNVRRLNTPITSSTIGTTATVKRKLSTTIVASVVGTAASVKRKLITTITASTIGTTATTALQRTVVYFVTAAATVGTAATVIRQGKLNVTAFLRGQGWGSGGAGAILGMTNQSLGTVVLSDVETALGRPFVGLRQNQNVTSTSFSTASSQYDLGYVHSYRNIEPHDANAWPLTVTGNYDIDLNTTITNVMALSSKWTPTHPFIVTWHHEQTIDNATQQGYPTAGTQQQYIDSFRYVRGLFDAAGATVRKADGTWNGGNVVFAYVPWAKMFVSPPAGQSYTDFDPNQGTSPAPAGTSYYELVGCDIYNPIISAGTLKYGPLPATVLGPISSFASGQGMRFIIPEFGIDLSGFSDTASIAAKAQYVRDFADYLEGLGTGPGSCYGLWLTFSDSGGDYRINDTPDSLAAYQYLAAKPYFGKSIRTNASVIRRLSTTISSAPGTAGSLARRAGLTIKGSVPTVGSVARRTALRASAVVGTAASVIRRAGLKIASTVATVATAALQRTIPASANPERSNQITVTQEPNQISVQQTSNVVSINGEPNQTIITHNGVNIISVEEAA